MEDPVQLVPSMYTKNDATSLDSSNNISIRAFEINTVRPLDPRDAGSQSWEAKRSQVILGLRLHLK